MKHKPLQLIAVLVLLLSLAATAWAGAKQTAGDAPPPVAAEHRERFDLGILFVQAAYHAGESERDGEARRAAIEELASLIDYLEQRPETAVLRRALRMVLRNTGAAEERGAAVEHAAAAYAATLPVAERWYFGAGASVANALRWSYLGEETKLRQELQQLRQLLQTAPARAPASLLGPLRDLARYGRQTAFGLRDLAAIEQTARGALDSLNQRPARWAD